MAGSNISSELRTLSRSFARGALASLSFVLVSYWLLALLIAACIDRGTLKSNDFILAEVLCFILCCAPSRRGILTH